MTAPKPPATPVEEAAAFSGAASAILNIEHDPAAVARVMRHLQDRFPATRPRQEGIVFRDERDTRELRGPQPSGFRSGRLDPPMMLTGPDELAERDAVIEQVRGELAYAEMTLRDLARKARKVMDDLDKHGPSIVPHLIDTDDNDGQQLRAAIDAVILPGERTMGDWTKQPTVQQLARAARGALGLLDDAHDHGGPLLDRLAESLGADRVDRTVGQLRRMVDRVGSS